MSKIFVGGLAISVSNDDLGRHFAHYGTVVDVVAMKQRGFGFVEFAEGGAGQAAVHDGPHALHGKETSVKLAATREAMAEVKDSDNDGQGPPRALPNKLFVGGLPKTVTTQQLTEYFGSYGELSDAVVMGDRGFGFVAFHECEAMQKVLDQDHFFDGQPFSVKPADGQRPTRPSGGGCGGLMYSGPSHNSVCGGSGKGAGAWGGGSGVTKVFVGGIPKDMQTQELRDFFSWYGRVVDAIAMDGRGFGFVEFGDQLSVDNLMRNAANIVIRGFKCSLRLADGKKSAVTQQGGGYGQDAGHGGCCGYGPARGCGKGGGITHTPGGKCFVGGLPGQMSDEELKAFFSVYGDITDSKVMPGRGFGFVTFASVDAAENALRDRHEVDGRPLTVKLADGKGGPGVKGGAPY